MALPSFFKIPKHKEFNFIPRYYNERKEKLQERIKDIELEMGVKSTDSVYQSRIARGSMRRYMDKRRTTQKRSNFRLLLILAALILMVYLIITKVKL